MPATGPRAKGTVMPRSPRIIVCSCEDLTLSDVEQCLEKGYRDIESVKRYTGFGTGICQGRSCLHNISKILVRHGVKEEDMKPFTPRPPVYPVPLGMLARLEPKDGPPDLKDEPGLQRQARGVRGGAVSRGGEDESLRQKRSDEGTMVGGRGETALPTQEERGSAPDRRLGESTEPHMPRHPDGRDTTHPEAVHPRQGIGGAQAGRAGRAPDGPPDPNDEESGS